MIDPLLKKEWVPLHLRQNLSFMHIMGIASSNLVPSVCFMVTPTFFGPLSEKLHVSQLGQTIILFFGSFSGFVVCPIVGLYSDNSMCKWGRRRIYIVVSMFLMILGFIFMMYCVEIGKWMKPKNPELLQQILFGFSFNFIVTAVNILQTPARSICTDVTPIHQQNLMANICSVFNGLGGIIMNIIGGLKLEQYTKLNQEQFVLVVGIVLVIIAIIITVVVTPEEPLHVKPPKINPIRLLYDAFRQMPKLMIHSLPSLTFAVLATFQFSYQFNHFMGKVIFHGDNSDASKPDMVKRYNDGVSWSMFCGAARCGAQFVYGFVCTKISEKIGFKWTSVIGYSLMTIGLFLFFFVDNQYVYLLIVSLIGIGFGTYMSIPFGISSISTTINKLDFGVFHGILIVFDVIGEYIGNFGVGMGLGQIWPDNPRMLIGISSVFGVITVISSFWIIEPIIESKANMMDSFVSLNEN